MRLFLAVFPPQQFRDYFRDVLRGFDDEKRNLKPANLEQMHLSLRFIGANVNEASRFKISAALVKLQGTLPKPEIKIKNLRFGFDRQSDPRVLFVTIARNKELDSLVDILHKQIRALGQRDTIIWKQNFDKNYHISLARLKPMATRSTGRKVQALLKKIDLPLPEPFIAHEMYMMQSTITRSKPEYKRLERILL